MADSAAALAGQGEASAAAEPRPEDNVLRATRCLAAVAEALWRGEVPRVTHVAGITHTPPRLWDKISLLSGGVPVVLRTDLDRSEPTTNTRGYVALETTGKPMGRRDLRILGRGTLAEPVGVYPYAQGWLIVASMLLRPAFGSGAPAQLTLDQFQAACEEPATLDGFAEGYRAWDVGCDPESEGSFTAELIKEEMKGRDSEGCDDLNRILRERGIELQFAIAPAGDPCCTRPILREEAVPARWFGDYASLNLETDPELESPWCNLLKTVTEGYVIPLHDIRWTAWSVMAKESTAFANVGSARFGFVLANEDLGDYLVHYGLLPEEYEFPAPELIVWDVDYDQVLWAAPFPAMTLSTWSVDKVHAFVRIAAACWDGTGFKLVLEQPTCPADWTNLIVRLDPHEMHSALEHDLLAAAGPIWRSHPRKELNEACSEAIKPLKLRLYFRRMGQRCAQAGATVKEELQRESVPFLLDRGGFSKGQVLDAVREVEALKELWPDHDWDSDQFPWEEA